MKNECSIVQDLLPLYAEKLVSEDTAEFVAEHAARCAECREALANMAFPQIPEAARDETPLRAVRRKLALKRIVTAVCAALLALALATAAFSALNAPSFFPYSEDLMHLQENSDGSVTIAFRGDVAFCSAYDCAPDGIKTWFVEAYSSPWARFFGVGGGRSLVLQGNASMPMAIYYCQNNGEDDVCVYGGENVPGGVRSLERLTLGYYFVIACAAAAALGAAALLFKRARRVLEKILLMPVAYIAGHAAVMGARMTTYAIERDFACIMLVSVMLYCAAVMALWLFRTGRELKT